MKYMVIACAAIVAILGVGAYASGGCWFACGAARRI